MITEHDKAYAAGYIDGDGCFYIGVYKTTKCSVYEYSVQVSSTKKESVDWLKEKFGGSIRTKKVSGNRKVPYAWKISGEKSISFADEIRPYLVAKHVECQIFIEFGLHVIQNNFQPLTEDAIDHRITLIKNIRKARHEWYKIGESEEIKNSEKQIEPCETDFAYLGGLIDSEGCFRIKKWKPKNKPNYVYAICLEIGNTQKHFFKWLMDRFEGNTNIYEAQSENHNRVAIWTLSARKLSKHLSYIVGHLKIKRPVCEKIIEFHETMIPNGGDRHSDKFKKLYDRIIDKREKIVDDIHILNKKGHLKSS